MPLYTKKEFATNCGQATNWLAVQISRGKVVMSGDYVDDTIPQNKAFMVKWADKAVLKQMHAQPGEEVEHEEYPEPEPASLPPVKEKARRPPAEPKPSNLKYEEPAKQKGRPPIVELPGVTPQLSMKWDNDLTKIQLAIKQQEMDLALKQVRLDKENGLVIPTEMVRTVFKAHTRNITTAYHDAAEGFLMEISKMKGLNAVEMANMKGVLVRSINDATEKAVAESKRMITQIVREHSAKRGVGDHD